MCRLFESNCGLSLLAVLFFGKKREGGVNNYARRRREGAKRHCKQGCILVQCPKKMVPVGTS